MPVQALPHGGVAQLGEHLPCKQGVKSSNLSVSIAGQGRRKKQGRTLKTEYQKHKKRTKDISQPELGNRRQCAVGEPGG